MKDKPLAEVLSELRSRLTKDMDLLAKSQLNLVQASIAQELLSGRRTVAELTEAIHTTRPGDPDYTTQYSKIRREIREMESRGLVVSQGLFGRDKPYRLTQLAVSRLTEIQAIRTTETRAIPRIDTALYLSVMILGLLLVGIVLYMETGPMPFLALAFTFAFGGGAAFCRFIETLRRIT